MDPSIPRGRECRRVGVIIVVSLDEIIVFDSTGMVLQDVVTAAAVYEKAVREGAGTLIDFAQ